MNDHREFNKEIIDLLAKYAEENPAQRFGQILFNLDINQFNDTLDPSKSNYLLRDTYNDLSEGILERVKERISTMRSKYPK
jgi:hypothetical protein